MLSISPRSIPSPLGQNSEKFSMLLFRGGGSLWGATFCFSWKSVPCYTLWWPFQLDRSQACSARSPRNFQFHFSVGESSYGPNFLVFSEIALGALPYVFNVTSLDAKSARPDLRENFNLTFQGGESPCGSNLFECHKRAHGVLPYCFQFQLARSQDFSPVIRVIFNFIFPGGRVRLGPSFWNFQK